VMEKPRRTFLDQIEQILEKNQFRLLKPARVYEELDESRRSERCVSAYPNKTGVTFCMYVSINVYVYISSTLQCLPIMYSQQHIRLCTLDITYIHTTHALSLKG
jgi:hypothetical protein